MDSTIPLSFFRIFCFSLPYLTLFLPFALLCFRFSFLYLKIRLKNVISSTQKRIWYHRENATDGKAKQFHTSVDGTRGVGHARAPPRRHSLRPSLCESPSVVLPQPWGVMRRVRWLFSAIVFPFRVYMGGVHYVGANWLVIKIALFVCFLDVDTSFPCL